MGDFAVILDNNGNVFICSCLCVGVGKCDCVATDGFFRYGKIAAIISKRQLPLVSGVFGNRGQPSVGLSVHSGRCEEDSVQI